MRRLLAPTLLLLTLHAHAADVSPAEVAKLVAKAAKEKPAWWETTTLAYPPTLDLTCPTNLGWNVKVSPGSWMWDVINPNPGRWQEGTKFWHFVLANAEQKQITQAEQNAINQLGHCYGELLQDWPRALHWYQRADQKFGANVERIVMQAYAQFRLGARGMAQSTLKVLRQDLTRHGSLIKLQADLGNYQEAYRLAKDKVSTSEDIGWFMWGYTAQLQGDWRKALDGFTKAAAAEQQKSGRDWKQTRERATAAIAAITLFEALDLKQVADGTYRDNSTGYSGPVAVEVTVQGQRITGVKVTSHQEKQYYAALVEMPAKLIAKQHVKGVDATLGATITSEAIVYATAKALRQGQR